jgi:glycosyltransferase involved in cell wall biosynthesis
MTTRTVSVVVPMYNEAGAIAACIDGFSAQTWPLEQLEVIVVDGGSRDGSTAIVEQLAATRPWLKLVDNPARRASAAFNIGLDAAGGELICLLSAHGEIGPTFVEDSVRVIDESGAAGVGGILEHRGRTSSERAIGLAMTSRFGMASPFRYARDRRVVDTIGHPMYKAKALRDVGGFDETLDRNSDYELNYRLRQAGHSLVFDPAIRSTYRPRATLPELARQFWWYGRWKARVVRRHPGSVRPRHLVPPLAVLGALGALFAWRAAPVRRASIAVAVAYGAGVASAGAASKPLDADADPLVLLAAFPVMHAAWGAGFLWSVVRRWR